MIIYMEAARDSETTRAIVLALYGDTVPPTVPVAGPHRHVAWLLPDPVEPLTSEALLMVASALRTGEHLPQGAWAARGGDPREPVQWKRVL